MSKEQITTIVTVLIALITILAFLFNINNQIGNVREQVATNTVAIMSNSKAIAELRDDVREIRGIVNSHLELHEKHAMLSGDSEATAQVELTSNTVEKVNYFSEVAFGAEFGDADELIRKWVGDINIFVLGEAPSYLTTELDFIIDEINGLVRNVQLNLVDSIDDSNYTIFFGSGKDYKLLEPGAISRVKNNWGLVSVHWNSKNEIYKGSIYVDIKRAKNKNQQKHILREELTQSLGILKDSYRYSDSIFYQRWSKTTDYSEIDRFIISTLYSDKIKVGMTKDKVRKILLNGN